jgi:hypothetical protein
VRRGLVDDLPVTGQHDVARYRAGGGNGQHGVLPTGAHELALETGGRRRLQGDAGGVRAFVSKIKGPAAGIDLARHTQARSRFHDHIVPRAEQQVARQRATGRDIEATCIGSAKIGRIPQIDRPLDGPGIDHRSPERRIAVPLPAMVPPALLSTRRAGL